MEVDVTVTLELFDHPHIVAGLLDRKHCKGLMSEDRELEDQNSA